MRKLIIVGLQSLISSLLFSQTTLERNSNVSHSAKRNTDNAEVLNFQYQSLYPKTTDNDRVWRFAVDSSLINADRTTISRLINDSIKVRNPAQSAAWKDLIRTKVLEANLKEARISLLKAKLDVIQAGFNNARDSINEIDVNARRLVNFSWDIFNKIDSATEINNRTEFSDSLSFFRTTIERFSDRSVWRALDSLDVIERYLESLSDRPISVDDSTIILRTQLQLGKVKKRIGECKSELDKYLETWRRLIEKYVKKKETSKKIELAALPFFNTIPGLKDYTATLSILGNSTVTSGEGVYQEFGAYTGILGSADELSRYSLFIPEISTYGFFFKNNFALQTKSDSTARVGLNASFYYLGKKLKLDTSGKAKAIITSSFQFKFGLEYIVVKNLSIYGNVNAQSFMTNRNIVKDSLGIKKDLLGFIDFGFRMLLNPASSLKIDGWKLHFDLNFIINGGDIKTIGTVNDPIIPNFRIGLRKEFGRL